ncbi:MAG: aminotransferase class III-fold pyridoxal phosphate-dependent enzyme [Clostridia bacterium]|nr:aminotransferase class III-fold pyridoxal phosphate-dependent enzyme [Clostridia bacterium]
MKNISRSLKDLLGSDYMEAVISVATKICGMEKKEAEFLANEKVDFFPDDYIAKMDALAEKTGEKLLKGFENSEKGAPTDSFGKAAHPDMAPIGGFGCTRIGEDGKAYLIAKSEHYHASLGHNFPGYKLINNARKLGILNATHNNTRGYITRLAERRIIAAANGAKNDAEIDAILASKEPHVLNRIINLETGSLAGEAGIKMMLSRFYKLDGSYGTPFYDGKIPVFLVMEDNKEGLGANYHGTTIMAQTFRGMWPTFYEKCEKNELYKVVSVKKNDISDFEEKIKKYNSGSYKTAGFIHEIILMNYAGIRLTKEYLEKAHELCKATDTLIMVDEIQSCMWYDGMFLFRKYGLKPDFVMIGKGFPGGEYSASKLLTTAPADNLNQFGALVTNGQEELASLSYLITMEFASANGKEIDEMGEKIEKGILELSKKYPELLPPPEGLGHLSAIHFNSVEKAAEFTKIMNGMCVDISAQLYKPDCPPAVLLKPPVITDDKVLSVLIEKINEGLLKLKPRGVEHHKP